MKVFVELIKNIISFFFNLLTRNLLMAVVVYVCHVPLSIEYSWFMWHVVLCTVGLIPFMTEGLMLFSPELDSKKITRKQKSWIHGFLFLLGTILVSFGCIETFLYLEDGYHLYTIHGKTGLAAMVLFIVSVLLGILANYSQHLGIPVFYKFIHNLVGLAGYLVGMVSLCYAYYTHWFVYYTYQETRLIALIVTILGTLWTIKGSLVSGFNQLTSSLKIVKRFYRKK